jgi:peptide/nickel transport system permease protein
VLAVVLAWALVPGVFAPYSPLAGESADSLAAPSWEHLFGADLLGRDVLSRVIHGTRTTLAATFVAIGIGAIIGSVLGLLSGYFKGAADVFLMRVVDVLLAIPALLLAMAIVVSLGYGTVNVAIAVGVATIPGFARVTRSEVLRIAPSEFIEASSLAGARGGHILARHLLPNVLPPVGALAVLEFGSAVLMVASLGFLGFGAPPPNPEWGLAVVEGRNQIATQPWLSVLPGVVIAVTVLSANRISHILSEGR